ncbi:MAG: hypothetical protein KME21_06905 [Desmonostoc vinosum HA7617-LM4]|jgi:hypothetical protein|nr:hypothetical protein [Desmonostoc vinosum HA7617-LM4]
MTKKECATASKKEQLKNLNDFVKDEWVMQGNSESDFQTIIPKILIILDNAIYHKKKTVLADIENNLGNIQLLFRGNTVLSSVWELYV